GTAGSCVSSEKDFPPLLIAPRAESPVAIQTALVTKLHLFPCHSSGCDDKRRIMAMSKISHHAQK
ncbi:MAG: hypothetical protein LBC37_05115, partial [Zoogloeaceae bacterium]|nr:hypothetical protein [Zoogloeaceae bacterium]